jgi:phage terminase large subunit-like protein
MPALRRVGLRRRTESTDAIQGALGSLRGSERVLAFFRTFLRHSNGEYRGRRFEPLPFQQQIIREIFDPTLPNGRRRIREALLMIPRKGGKTTLSAGLALSALYDGEQRGQVVVAANSRDQASLLFNAAADAVEQDPVLRARSIVSRSAKRITDRVSLSTLRALAAESGTAHGLDLTCWIYDELHAATNDELLNVLRTSVGARREPLGIVISTAGFDLESPLGHLYEHAKRWQVDPSVDPYFHASIFEASESDAWDDPATWHKANPALGSFRSLEEMEIAANRARQVPSQQDAFKRLYLNIWTSQESSWLDLAAWDGCAGAVSDDELRGKTAYFGLDLSSNIDLTALVAIIQHGDRLVIRNWNWLPADGMHEREERDRVPYRQWVKDGRLETCPGNAIDLAFITARVREIAKGFNVGRISFDRWGSTAVSQELSQGGLPLVPFGQGFASMSAPTKALQTAVLAKKILHNGCPLLRWQAANCTVQSDAAGNIKPVKQDRFRHRKHIDSIVAAVMAMDGATRAAGPSLLDFLSNPIIL